MESFMFKSPGDLLQVHSLAAILVGGLLLAIILPRSNQSLAHIPTIGPSGRLTSYLGAFRFLVDGNNMIEEGYRKYKGSPFKVATFSRWTIVVSGPQAVEDIRQAADDELSFLMAMQETLASEYTLGQTADGDNYHIPIIRHQLTKNLGVLYPDIRDEIIHAFDDEVGQTPDWTKVSASKAVMQIVCRASNRVLVGLPLCREPDWLSLNVNFAMDVMKAATIIWLFPNFLKPIVGRMLTDVQAKIQRGMNHMMPVIQYRQRHMEEYGETWDEKPNDMLSWMMDKAPEAEKSTRNLTLRLMLINFVAIHTTSMSFTHALYTLAVMPHYIQPMREEVEAVVSEEGWTKASMSKLYKVDSFLKESQRFTGLASLTMDRKVLKDFTFSDGTFIPKGSYLNVPTALHRDDENYSNPSIFDGFRFVDMDVSEGDRRKSQMVATNVNYLVFGHGRHACPGRFFAANEQKTMMAHILLNYDIKLENEGVRPPNVWLSYTCIPNPDAKILFRKRQS